MPICRPKWPTPSDDDLVSELKETDADTLFERRDRLLFIIEETEGPDGASIPGIPFEGGLLMWECWRSFVVGNFLSSILCAQAFLERCLAIALEARGIGETQTLKFSELIDSSIRHGILTDRLANSVKRLRATRNAYAHHRQEKDDKWHSWFLKRVVREARGDYYGLAERDARRAVECCVDYIRSINPGWIPPR